MLGSPFHASTCGTCLPRALIVTVALLAAGCAKHDAESVRTALAKRLAAVESVGDVQRTGDTITFTLHDGSGGTTPWRVQIDALLLGRNPDPKTPFQADVRTSWYRDGQALNDGTALPAVLVAQGFQPDMVALWEQRARRWRW